MFGIEVFPIKHFLSISLLLASTTTNVVAFIVVFGVFNAAFISGCLAHQLQVVFPGNSVFECLSD